LNKDRKNKYVLNAEKRGLKRIRRLGMSNWIKFSEESITATKAGKCSVCGKHCKLTRKFYQTLNPYNKDKNGLMKTRGQIQKELKEDITNWKGKQITHVKCENKVIVKVQRAFNNDNILVYNKDKTIIWEGESKDVYRQLEESNSLKAYFIAEVNKKGFIEIMTRITDQDF